LEYTGFLTTGRDQLNRLATDRRLVRGIRWGLSMAAFLVLGYVVVENWRMLAPLLNHGAYGWLAVALPVYLLAMAVAMVGWHSISRTLDVSRGALLDSTFYALSMVAGRLPGGIWGLVARVYLYKSDSVTSGRVVAAWAIEQGVMLASALLCLSSCLIMTNPIGWSSSGRALAVTFLLGVVGLCVKRPAVSSCLSIPLRKTPLRVLIDLERKSVFRWFAVYAAVWLLGGLLLFVLLQVFGPLPLTDLSQAEVAWIGSRGVALLLTVLPTSFGITEISLALLLTPVVPGPVAVAVAVCARLITTLGEALVAGGATIVGRINQHGTGIGIERD